MSNASLFNNMYELSGLMAYATPLNWKTPESDPIIAAFANSINSPWAFLIIYAPLRFPVESTTFTYCPTYEVAPEAAYVWSVAKEL
jgi:hypothetical protein